MKTKVYFIIMISLVIFFMALSIFFGYYYFKRGETINNLNIGLEGIQSSSTELIILEETEVEDEQEEIEDESIEENEVIEHNDLQENSTENVQNETLSLLNVESGVACYNKDRVVNSNYTYASGFNVTPPQGTLYIENNMVIYSYVDLASNNSDFATYLLNENVVDVCRATGGFGEYEQTAFITQSGRVYLNYNTEGTTVVELTNLPKIVRIIAVAILDDSNRKSTLIGIDESGNCYDLEIARNSI